MKKEIDKIKIGSTMLDKLSGGTWVKTDEAKWHCEMNMDIEDSSIHFLLRKKKCRFEQPIPPKRKPKLIPIKSTYDWEKISSDIQRENTEMVLSRGFGMLIHEITEWYKNRISNEPETHQNLGHGATRLKEHGD